jgi:hypothetical protein
MILLAFEKGFSAIAARMKQIFSRPINYPRAKRKGLVGPLAGGIWNFVRGVMEGHFCIDAYLL